MLLASTISHVKEFWQITVQIGKKNQNDRNLKKSERLLTLVFPTFLLLDKFPLPLVKEYTRCDEHQEESHIEADQNVFHC